LHVLKHVPEPGGPGGGGDGDGGAKVKEQPVRVPQSVQSVHGVHTEYSWPLPPSSQSPSEAYRHVSTHVPEPGGPGGGGGGRPEGGGGGLAPQLSASRGPQSLQSVHAVQSEYSNPVPPSSQSPSEA